MSTRQGADTAHLSLVDNKARGERIKDRAAKLGYDVAKFARATKTDRSTLVRALNGGSRETLYVKLEEWLAREERRTSAEDVDMTTHAEHVVFRFTGNFGVTAVVEGPAADIVALREAAKDLFHEMQRSADHASDE